MRPIGPNRARSSNTPSKPHSVCERARTLLAFATLSLTLASSAFAVPQRQKTAPRPGNIYYVTGGPCIDTVAAPWREVFVAAQRAFVHDHWRIERADTTKHEIATEWKPLHEALARIIVGNVDARCTVKLTPLGPTSTRVAFDAVIASPKSLEENPRLRVGQHAYRLAALDWHSEVKEFLGVPE
jgi:hypothetical protein